MRAAAAGAVVLLVLAGNVLAAGLAGTLPADLPAAERTRLQQVTDHPSVSARANGDAFLLRRDVLEYLLDHPEFTTHVIQALRVGRYRVWREPDGLWLDDAAGAVAKFRVVYKASGSRVVHLQGSYKPRFLPALHGQVVAVLEYTAEPAADGKSLITPTLTGIVKVDNRLLDAVSRLLSAVVTERAAKVTRRMVGDLTKTARAIDGDPAGVDNRLSQWPGVSPHELAEFRRLLARP
ncbi:MAG: hypothetical protein ACRELZ_22850 [Candidatus Rokuibacteriota bacterium]